jgi:large subunit ribosomal protein L3
MSKGHKPVAGSRGFWPKKRASRIYGSVTTHPVSKEAAPLDFAGYKAGMTSVIVVDNRKASVTHGQEIVKPATVIDCPVISVAAIRLYRKTPYGLQTITDIWADKFSKDLARKTHVPEKKGSKKRIEDAEKDLEKITDIRLMVHTRPSDSGIGKKTPEMFEICIGGSTRDKWSYAKQKLGGEIKAEEIFKEGDWIDVKAVSKGKGYQGPVKRFGVKIRGRKHTKKRRHIGNIGSRIRKADG